MQQSKAAYRRIFYFVTVAITKVLPATTKEPDSETSATSLRLSSNIGCATPWALSWSKCSLRFWCGTSEVFG